MEQQERQSLLLGFPDPSSRLYEGRTAVQALLLFNLLAAMNSFSVHAWRFDDWLIFAYFITDRCVGYLDYLQTRGSSILIRKDWARVPALFLIRKPIL